MKRCLLEPNMECTNCGRCDDRCELDPMKICDNCFRCLDGDGEEYLEIPISCVFTEEDYLSDAQMQPSPQTHVHAQTLPGLFGERLLRIRR